MHDAQSALAQRSVIRRHPAPANVDPGIDSGNYQTAASATAGTPQLSLAVADDTSPSQASAWTLISTLKLRSAGCTGVCTISLFTRPPVPPVAGGQTAPCSGVLFMI